MFSCVVKAFFTKNLDFGQKMVVSGVWPFVRKKMMESLDLGRAQGEESQRIVNDELT